MAKSSTSFTKGQSGNLAGRPKETENFKNLKKLTREQLELFMSHLVYSTPHELIQILTEAKDGVGNHSALKVMIANTILQATTKKGIVQFDKILDRIVGKPKQSVAIGGDEDNPTPLNLDAKVIISLPSNGREKIG